MNDRISQCHSPTTHGWYLGLQPRSGASLLSTTDCLSQKQRRWPEDMAWHPEGKSIFSVYNADDGDSQISSLNLNRTKGVFIYACTRVELGRFSLGQPLEKKKRKSFLGAPLEWDMDACYLYLV